MWTGYPVMMLLGVLSLLSLGDLFGLYGLILRSIS